MNPQDNGGGYTPPAGLTPVGAAQPVQQSQGYTPPTGLTPVGAPTPISSSNSSVHNDELKITKPWYTPTGLAQRAGSAVEGVGEGVFSTLAGAGDLVNKAHDAITGPDLESTMTGHNRQLIPTQELHKLAGDENTPGSSNNYNKTGYGGETLMEFMMGDEALKGMSTADKALNAGKTLKVVEKSPKLMQALKIGAKELAKQSAHAGIVQGVQTYVRSGGNAGAALESGLEGAATTGVLGGVLGTAGYAASKLGEAGETAAQLAETAANAPEKQDIVKNVQGQLKNSQDAVHTNYENQTKDFENRLQGQTIDPKTSPIATKAAAILQKPVPEDDPAVAELKDIRGEKLDKPVRDFLENTAKGKQRLTPEDVTAAKAANAKVVSSQPKGLLGQMSDATKPQPVEPQAKDLPPRDAHGLIQWRQQVRALASEYEPGDINARALNRLLYDVSDHSSAFDDTFQQLADKSNDPAVGAEYKALRDDYRTKINIYDSPVIKNLMDGKPDDAAKAFIGYNNASGRPVAGKTAFNVDQLHTVLGDEGFNQFRNSVYENMMRNASDKVEEGSDKVAFNPAKFVGMLGDVAKGTKSDFFGIGNPNVLPQNYLTSLTSDAKSAANAQKLIRYGLIAGPGAAATALAPTAGGLSTVLAFILGREGAGGIAKGREVLDYVANHPKTWSALRSVSKAAESNAAQTATKVIPKVGQAAVALGNANQSTNNKAAVYNTANSALGGTQDQVVVPADASRGVGQVTLPVTTPQQ